jgi:hypothetical protein
MVRRINQQGRVLGAEMYFVPPLFVGQNGRIRRSQQGLQPPQIPALRIEDHPLSLPRPSHGSFNDVVLIPIPGIPLGHLRKRDFRFNVSLCARMATGQRNAHREQEQYGRGTQLALIPACLAEFGMIVRRQNANRLWAGAHDFIKSC